jgi:hypothetical protein
MNSICQSRFYLRLGMKFFTEKFNVLSELLEKNGVKQNKDYEENEHIKNSFELKNWISNLEPNNKHIVSDFINTKFTKEECESILEFIIMQEFNFVRQKEFINLGNFFKIYLAGKEAEKKLGDIKFSNLDSSELYGQGESNKTTLILVSGVPGSGKTKFGEYLTKLLSNETIKVGCFKMDL